MLYSFKTEAHCRYYSNGFLEGLYVKIIFFFSNTYSFNVFQITAKRSEAKYVSSSITGHREGLFLQIVNPNLGAMIKQVNSTKEMSNDAIDVLKCLYVGLNLSVIVCG